MEKKFKSSIFQILVFVILTQFLAIYFTYKFSFSPLTEEVYEPFGQTVEGAVENSIPMILSVFVFGLFIAFFIKLRKFNFIKIFLTTLLIFSTFFINQILFSVIFPESVYLPWIASALLVFLVFLVTYYKKFNLLSKLLSLLIGAECAGYFATILTPPTVFILPLLMAAYDIYAVFAGPLKKIVGKPTKVKGPLKKLKLDFLSLLIVDFHFVKIGLGDMIFYSMLPATAFMLFGLQRMLLTILATNVGAVLTLFLLNKKKIPLPGLPIPMLLGVLALVL